MTDVEVRHDCHRSGCDASGMTASEYLDHIAEEHYDGELPLTSDSYQGEDIGEKIELQHLVG